MHFILRLVHRIHAGMAWSQRRLALVQDSQDLRRDGGFALSAYELDMSENSGSRVLHFKFYSVDIKT
jgi:hypothetical protein